MGANSPNEEAIFNAARQINDKSARSAHLRDACPNDAQRVRIEALLAIHNQEHSFLNSPAPGLEITNFDSPIAERPGTVIGPYKLLEQIGEGGMGMVFMAEQTRPIQRRVALKIIKPGMDTRQVIARFEAERQALALMDHPNIARVLDAGATDAGRPYFVMELVRGIPLTEFCDRNNYSIRQRLELFVDVCHAVQHAHQKGIIHRDIKPTNVLVTLHDGKPVIKVIDFGVAKATGQKLTEKTLFTGFAEMIGTPLYMSPEQAEFSGLDVDTRSDIYSLGVLLYELLTGHTPFDSQRLKSAPFDELRRIIRDEEPLRPSTRISTLAQQAISTVSQRRSCDPRHLSRLFQGELDWIVMKSLEKDRNRRYETASGLLQDVQRYLADEPVEACPPSALYRFQKFARRNKVGLATAIAICLALLVAVGSIGWIARDRATRLAVVKQQITEALNETKFGYQSGKLSEAMSSVKRAEGLLASGGGSNDLQQQVDQWRTDLETVNRLDQIRLDQASQPKKATGITPVQERNTSLELMEEVKIEVEPRGLDQAGANQAYQQEFRRYDLDLDSVDVEKSAERIRNSPIKQALVAALDDWFHVSQRDDLLEKKTSGRKELLQIARLADPDPWRDQLRDAIQRGDDATLTQLAAEKKIVEQPIPTVLLLVRALEARATNCVTAEGEAILREVQRRHPNDFWVNAELANCLPTEESADEIAFQRIASALRPDSLDARAALAARLRSGQHYGEAEVTWREILRTQPSNSRAYHELVGLLRAQKKDSEAEAAFREEIRINPNDIQAHLDLGTSLGQRAKSAKDENAWDVAAAEFVMAIDLSEDDPTSESLKVTVCRALAMWDEVFNRVVKLRPEEPTLWIGRGQNRLLRKKWPEAAADFAKANHSQLISTDYAGLLLLLDNKQGYNQLCKALVDRSGDQKDGLAGLYMARICAIGPSDAVDLAQLVEWAKDAQHSAHSYPRHVLGLTQYRAGQYEMAIESLQKSNAGSWGIPNAQNWFVLAMAHQRLGDKEEARQCLDTARQLTAQAQPKNPDVPADLLPGDWMCIQVLSREAEALLHSDGSNSNSHTSDRKPESQNSEPSTVNTDTPTQSPQEKK